MKKKKKNRDCSSSSEKSKGPTPVILKPLEVRIEEVNGNTSKLIRKFNKKVRKAEVLKPYYNRLMYFTPKPQKRREKLRKAIYEEKKRQQKLED